MSKIAIALGGNIGNSAEFFAQAVKILTANGVSQITLSPTFTTQAVDCPVGTADFQNAALTASYSGTPEQLLLLCQQIEQQLGRPADHLPNRSRTIDLDLITFDNLTLNTPTLTLPHPRVGQRKFVLEPLFSIDPTWQIGEESVESLLKLLD